MSNFKCIVFTVICSTFLCKDQLSGVLMRLFFPELDKEPHEVPSHIPVDSTDDTFTWAHKAMFIGIVLAGVIAFLRWNGKQAGDSAEDKTKA